MRGTTVVNTSSSCQPKFKFVVPDVRLAPPAQWVNQNNVSDLFASQMPVYDGAKAFVCHLQIMQ